MSKVDMLDYRRRHLALAVHVYKTTINDKIETATANAIIV